MQSSASPPVSAEARRGQDTANNEPPAKRRRVALACLHCRTRKSRCNGGRPACSSCDYLGFECIYEATLSNPSEDSMQARAGMGSRLEQRLKMIEDFLARSGARLSGDGAFAILERAATEALPSPPHPTLPRQQAGGGILLDVSDLQDLPSEQGSVTDGMAISFVDDREGALFGASSNIAYARHVLRAGSAHWGTEDEPGVLLNRTRRISVGGLIETSRPPSPVAQASPVSSLSSALTLPPVLELETLMRSYFSNTGLLFPFIHEGTFMDAYREFKQSNFCRVRRTWLGLLNMMLALASSTAPQSGPPGKRNQRATIFHDRAVKICKAPMLRFANLEIVHFLLLLVQYSQGTEMSVQAWCLHGMAVKTAMSLGLHCPQFAGQFTPIELEIRKRTWLGCVALDRVLSMTFGRPLSIPEEYVCVPAPAPWPQAPCTPPYGDLISDTNASHLSTAFFASTAGLYSVLGRTIGLMYGHNLANKHDLDPVTWVGYALELEQKLEEWFASVDPSLAPQTSAILLIHDTDDALTGRLRTILSLRYLAVRMLISRSSLLLKLDRVTKPAVDSTPLAPSISRVIDDSIQSCTQAAKDTIDIVHAALTTDSFGRGLLGAWWFTLFYVFSASLVIFASEIEASSNKTIGQPGVDAASGNGEYLKHAIDTMKMLGYDNTIVMRCVSSVKAFERLLLRCATGPLNIRNPSAAQSSGAFSYSPLFDNTDLLPLSIDPFCGDMELSALFASELFDESVTSMHASRS